MELQAEMSGSRETILREAAGIRRSRPDLPDCEAFRAEWDRDRITSGAVSAVAGSYRPRNFGGRRSAKARWPSR